VGLIVYLFKLPIYLPSSPEVYFWFLLFLVLALFLYFYINFTLSVVAFWIDEVWAARWLLGIILLEFFAGAFFPIDILPIWLVKIINLTPFPYLVFLPLKVWLQQIPPVEIPQKILICLIWTIVFWQLSKNLYKEGLKSYGAFGG
jgi:ABC-2 type transport system permease protein